MQRPSASRDVLIAVGAVVFCGWFLMKFHMDIANDSETQAYVGALLASATHGTLATDATGQYTALAPYVMWPFAANLRLITGAYLIRGLVFALLVLGIAFCGAAYAWWRRLGLAHVTALVGLVLLSTSAAFALEIRGWEIDKLIEPVLFLVAALAAQKRRYVVFGLAAILAAANAETGIFAPFLILLAPRDRKTWWVLGTSLAICSAEVLILQRIAAPTHIRPWIDTNPGELVNIAGGLCLLPVIALACGRAVSTGLRLLLYAIVPVWVLFVLATHRLDQGAAFLAPLAVVWLPVTLLQLELLVRSAPLAGIAREPEARAG